MRQVAYFLILLAAASSNEQPDAWILLTAGDVRGPWLGATRVGTAVPDAGWRWTTNEPFGYAPWYLGEPNNAGGLEDALHYYAGTVRGSTWNDLNSSTKLNGYVVEYE